MRSSHFRSIRSVIIAIAIAGAVTMSACYGEPLSTREEGTLGGAAVGAGGGALVGMAVGHPLAGAAIGGVVGAGTGMAIGNSMQNSEDRRNVGENY
jgi:osmotically inducible lipoprotein OsmB